MSTISIQDIRRDPAGFLHLVAAGEPIMVVDEQRTVAEVKPTAARAVGQRPWGLAAGEFTVPDEFDAPLPDDVLSEFIPPAPY
jgi:antitoxin (DNA-binding transcriptional repressor) of toxin-antitoxin stability system